MVISQILIVIHLIVAGLEVSVVAGADLGKRFDHGGAAFRRVLIREVDLALLFGRTEAQHNIDAKLHRRTGNLRNLTIIPAVETPFGVEGRFGSSEVYAAIQRKGMR